MMFWKEMFAPWTATGLIHSILITVGSGAGAALAGTVPYVDAPGRPANALQSTGTPELRWLYGEPDPNVCEYLGENDCWQPSVIEEGPPYMGFVGPRPPRTKQCVVKASHDPSGDDAPAVLQAFSECKENAHIVFENTTYYIASVMNTTGLQNVDVEVRGILEWNNTDIDYWLANSLSVGFQNQSSAWYLGGENVHFYGHGHGTLNGNGQVWYAYANGTSNLAGRPHAITIADSKDCVIEGLRFIRSQMWTMTVARSERILLQDVYVNNTCAPGAGTFSGCNTNTDGCDTVYANNITFLRWTVDNGDDSISLKQNSTNIYVADCDFFNGEGIAFGSIGQYPGQIEIMENFTARNVYTSNTGYGCRVKTWTGENKGYPPNGGGGGLGHAKNLTCVDFTMDNVAWAWSINQKTSYNGESGGDNTSLFQVEDIYFGYSTGTLTSSFVAGLQCSAAAPCSGIHITNDTFVTAGNGSISQDSRCTNVVDPDGFNCTAGCGSDDDLCPS